MTLAPGLHRGIPMSRYLALDALGSTELGWLATSPLYYRWRKDSRNDEDTESTALGTAVHCAVLEPDLFGQLYVEEPDVEAIGGARPRATKEYRERCAELVAGGRCVLKADTLHKVRAMAASVLRHPKARLVLEKAPERELTLIWQRDGRLCRGRADMLGPGILGDLKTTRNLARFSPFELTRFRYYVQQPWYRGGLERLGREISQVLLVAVESVAPFDVGVFALDEAALEVGASECEAYLALLDECERKGDWPGQFPNVAVGTITDQLAAESALADLEVA